MSGNFYPFLNYSISGSAYVDLAQRAGKFFKPISHLFKTFLTLFYGFHWTQQVRKTCSGERCRKYTIKATLKTMHDAYLPFQMSKYLGMIFWKLPRPTWHFGLGRTCKVPLSSNPLFLSSGDCIAPEGATTIFWKHMQESFQLLHRASSP